MTELKFTEVSSAIFFACDPVLVVIPLVIFNTNEQGFLTSQFCDAGSFGVSENQWFYRNYVVSGMKDFADYFEVKLIGNGNVNDGAIGQIRDGLVIITNVSRERMPRKSSGDIPVCREGLQGSGTASRNTDISDAAAALELIEGRQNLQPGDHASADHTDGSRCEGRR